jgi:hypothetical protein
MSTLYIATSNHLLHQKVHPREYVDTLLISLKHKLVTGPGDNLIELVEFNYFGMLLKQLAAGQETYDNIVVFPVDLVNYEVLDQIKQRGAGHGLAGTIAAAGLDYPSLGLDLIYIDFQKLKSLSLVDFGAPMVFTDELHLHYPQLNGNTYSFRATEQTSNATFGFGWILISQMLNERYTIENLSDLSPRRVRHHDYLLQAVSLDAEQVTVEFDQDQLDWIALTQQAIVARWQNDLTNTLEFSAAPVSKFTTDKHYVENFYTVVDFDFESLKYLHSLSHNDRTRIVFLSNNTATQDTLKTILNSWTGTNTALLFSDSELVAKLESFYNSFEPDEFAVFWSYVNSIYHEFYLTHSVDFVNDIESQRYVNNIVWAGDNGFVPSLLSLPSKTLAATEIVYKHEGQYATRSVGDLVFETDQYKEIYLTFRNTQTAEQLRVRYSIGDHLLGQKWARCCRYDYLLAEKSIVEKNYMLQHWEYQPGNPNARDIPALCSEMNRYVDVINAYFDGSAEDRVSYHITQYFDPATLDQQILNEIHHHFELLIGQVWSVSEYYKMANWGTKFAIRQLNNLCHEMESLRRPGIAQSAGKWSAGIYFPWIPTYRYKFVESDYDHFTQIQEFGNLCLHYAQLGKTPLEAYAGRDEEVFDDNITGLRYLSGEFDIMFMPDRAPELQQANLDRYNKDAFEWIRARGQDPESKFTGIGFIPVAKFNRSDFPGMTAEQVMLRLFEFDDIFKLELVDSQSNVVVGRTFDYTWRDVLNKTDPTRDGKFGTMFD